MAKNAKKTTSGGSKSSAASTTSAKQSEEQPKTQNESSTESEGGEDFTPEEQAVIDGLVEDGWGIEQDEESGEYTATKEVEGDGDDLSVTSDSIAGLGEAAQAASQPAQGDDKDTDKETDTEGADKPENGSGGSDGNVESHFMDELHETKPVDDNTAKVDWTVNSVVQEPDGLILEADEEARFEGVEVGGQVVVKENVYRKVYPRGAKYPNYIKLYDAGSVVPGQSVQRIRSQQAPAN